MSNVIPFPTGNTPDTADDRAVYTVAQVAELLSLSLGSTYALVRSGEIPARKLGRRWVIPKRRFHTWLDQLPTAPPPDDDEIRNGTGEV